ncbi:hypothetical protein CPB85DRAFT_352045 [Mucidula mucida]|nr:hypothetical protein CPB85DRAFT_352045 [Mucidula mucida]
MKIRHCPHFSKKKIAGGSLRLKPLQEGSRFVEVSKINRITTRTRTNFETDIPGEAPRFCLLSLLLFSTSFSDRNYSEGTTVAVNPSMKTLQAGCFRWYYIRDVQILCCETAGNTKLRVCVRTYRWPPVLGLEREHSPITCSQFVCICWMSLVLIDLLHPLLVAKVFWQAFKD